MAPNGKEALRSPGKKREKRSKEDGREFRGSTFHGSLDHVCGRKFVFHGSTLASVEVDGMRKYFSFPWKTGLPLCKYRYFHGSRRQGDWWVYTSREIDGVFHAGRCYVSLHNLHGSKSIFHGSTLASIEVDEICRKICWKVSWSICVKSMDVRWIHVLVDLFRSKNVCFHWCKWK